MSEFVKDHDHESLAEALEDLMTQAHDGDFKFYADGTVTVSVNEFQKTFGPEQNVGDVRMWYVAALHASKP